MTTTLGGALAVAACGGAVAAGGSHPTTQPGTQPVASTAPAATACTKGLRLDATLSDDFAALDTGRWRVYDHSTGSGTAQRSSGELYYRPDMATVANGRLALSIADQPTDVPDVPGPSNYPAGGVESTFDAPAATAGKASCVEIRTRGFAAFQPVDGGDQNVLSAAWLQTRPATRAANPNPEIDIQEFFRPTEAHHALHTWMVQADGSDTVHGKVDHCATGRPDDTEDRPGTVDDCSTQPLGLGDLTRSEHTYAVRREITKVDGHDAGLLTFYVDGRPTWVKEFPADSPFVTRPRHVVLSTQGNPDGGPNGSFPKTATYDWVHVWH